LTGAPGGRPTPRHFAGETGSIAPVAGPRRGLLRPAAIAGAALCALGLAGLVWFATPPPAENSTAPTDAIVVLTGGSLRLESGIELMREGKGRELFVSGVNRRVDLDDLLRVAGDAPHWLARCVAIGYQAENTEGNAQETARWMQRHGYRSLRLVTAWYHMPRSLLEFERAMPEIEIVPHPVFPELVKEERWWAWRGTASLLIGEYGKYLATLIRPVVEPPQPEGSMPIETEARR
jgi:uncharacterized SAM-binding protein YcdF (DUF218 family)